MIKINKPKDGPGNLDKRFKVENLKNKTAYENDPQGYIDGSKNIKFKDGIYNSKEVKDILKDSQYGKCCFCEKTQKDEDGAVEHFRPKGGYKINPLNQKEVLQRPGYYWLCYKWSNLYFVCDACNRKKANYFPLVSEKKRARSHHDDENHENPYLLIPDGKKDPRKHISFEYQFIRGRSNFGEKTIKICGLDRDALNQSRQKLLNDLKLIIDIFELPLSNDIPLEIREEIKNHLISCQLPNAEYSAAVVDYLHFRGIQVI